MECLYYVPHRATGPCLTKVPRASPKDWSPGGEADANASNVLFDSLLLCVTHRGKVDVLNEWAKEVLKEEPEACRQGAAWKPPKERWPRGGKYQVSSIYQPLAHAYKGVIWPEEVLDDVGKAMTAWRGEGAVDGLTGQLLKHYIAKPPLAARVSARDGQGLCGAALPLMGGSARCTAPAQQGQRAQSAACARARC